VKNNRFLDAGNTRFDNLPSVNNNMVWDIPKSAWGKGNILFWILSTWFGANLLVQAYWMGTYGTPLDANVLFDAFGPYAWAIAIVEIILWSLLLIYAIRRTSIRILSNNEHQTDSRAAEYV
jgi:sterol desaturase/sphingolipid hydroxylase (fatty acid hydroxylase superfamily)|tara:strand:+ start:1551 stop:1913 length:363 start_codon:yes stop_codon:yes gene_type:complete